MKDIEVELAEIALRLEALIEGGSMEAAEEAQLRLCKGALDMIARSRETRKAAPAPGPLAPAARPGARPAILYVEDEAPQRARVLQALGESYRVSSFGDAESALDAAKSEGFDLVIADLVLPGMGGLELIARLKALPRFAGVPMMALTSLDDPATEAEGYGGGLLQYVRKPCPPGQLALRVAALLEHARASSARAKRDARDLVDRALDPAAADPAPRAEARARDFGLSPRETEVALLVIEGLQNKEIAARLGISGHTVDNHLRAIYEKTSSGNRVELARALR